MRDYRDAKAMAKSLRSALARQGADITHAQSLELIAQSFGLADWNVLSAKIAAGPDPEPVRLGGATPILRIFDVDKARDFYVRLLGMSVDWEHRFGDDFPLYMQVSRGELVLHLSEHHGDATPGSTAFVWLKGLDAMHAELAARGSKAAIEPGAGDYRVIQLWDPFGNRLRLAERNAA